ncbi:hypothetical protein AUM76_21785 [Cronobacter sakazakii]|uniref:hypothetical protein n=1 Tax=Cronobacter sakazakii TaxID=28141 RepID=UPI002D7A4ADA|nr:hypothetical protein [Cronobacter sakazakii]EMC4355750.1 hypothetical protein [Cronobacter sakazakii]EMC4368135.1 hypothetical protein [Cronobacter sakazakii]EMC4397784.1 hypothetical protein [Cronobacter sakazakii]EME1826240.1 hypothetical protein [Cronobacter sakazakii]
MITKLQIMTWFEVNRKGTVKQLVEELGGKGDRVAAIVCGLVREGALVRSASTGMGTRCRLYELSEGKTNRQRIREYVTEHGTVSSRQVSEGTGLDMGAVQRILRDEHDSGRLERYNSEKCSEHHGSFLYVAAHELCKFGCSNPMTAFINQQLRAVRQEMRL